MLEGEAGKKLGPGRDQILMHGHTDVLIRRLPLGE
jgi:hypothetical protein